MTRSLAPLQTPARWSVAAALLLGVSGPIAACDGGDLEPIQEGSGGAATATSTAASTPVGPSSAASQGGDASSSSGDAAGSTSGSPSSSVGASTGSGGGDAGCKRGLASNDTPGPAFEGGVAWWYNWAIQGAGVPPGIEFVPMIWDERTAGDGPPAGASFLLGFNEPNFHAQADLTPQEAAALWPDLEASAPGIPLVSPAMNFCGPEDQCNGTNPYQYLRDFFAACTDCRVDYVAVHWYNCDLPSLRDYLEPGDNLEGFEQFGRPIWLTEFSCNPSASVADQEAFMREAVPYLEGNPNVFRYSWFSAGPIPNAELVDDDGTPTALGQVYLDLPRACD